MTHAHLTSIVLALLIFIIIVILQSKGKKIKVWQMILRASYILILTTGIMLFFSVYDLNLLYMIKAVVGFLMIGLFEMVIIWREKGKSTDILWIGFSIVLVVLFLLGFMMPMGVYMG